MVCSLQDTCPRRALRRRVPPATTRPHQENVTIAVKLVLLNTYNAQRTCSTLTQHIHNTYTQHSITLYTTAHARMHNRSHVFSVSTRAATRSQILPLFTAIPFFTSQPSLMSSPEEAETTTLSLHTPTHTQAWRRRRRSRRPVGSATNVAR